MSRALTMNYAALALVVLVQGAISFGAGRSDTSPDRGILFPGFDLGKDGGGSDDLVLRQLALDSRLPDKASTGELRLVISPGVLPIEELREVFLEQWLPKDMSVFEKRRRWTCRLSGLKLEESGGEDALVARYTSSADMAIQLVYTASSFLFFAKSQAPFIAADHVATDEEIKTILAQFLRKDICAQIAGGVRKSDVEAANGNKVTSALVFGIRPAVSPSETNRSVAGAAALHVRFVVSGRYVALTFGKLWSPGHAGPQPSGFSGTSLFVENPSGSKGFFAAEDGLAQRALVQKTTDSFYNVIRTLGIIFQQAPIRPEDIEKEDVEHSGMDEGRRGVVRALYRAVFASLRQINDYQEADRASVVEKSLDGVSLHPVAKPYQSELRSSILLATRHIPRERAAHVAKTLIESGADYGSLREELKILRHCVTEMEFVAYVQERIKDYSSKGREQRKELLAVLAESLPPRKEQLKRE